MQHNSENKREDNNVDSNPPAVIELGRPWGFHPNVLLVHWELHRRTGAWLAACATAEALIEALPEESIGWIYRSFALHQMGHVRAAWEKLLPGARKFPEDWRIAYNLASYACQLGDKAGAWNWLDRAIELGDADTIKSTALDDVAFLPLWAALGQLDLDASPEPAVPDVPNLIVLPAN